MYVAIAAYTFPSVRFCKTYLHGAPLAVHGGMSNIFCMCCQQNQTKTLSQARTNEINQSRLYSLWLHFAKAFKLQGNLAGFQFVSFETWMKSYAYDLGWLPIIIYLSQRRIASTFQSVFEPFTWAFYRPEMQWGNSVHIPTWAWSSFTLLCMHT